MDPSLDGPKRDVQPVRDFLVAQLPLVKQQKRFTVLRSQRRHRQANFFTQLVGRSLVLLRQRAQAE